MTPLQVFRRHFASLGSGDMRRIISDYAPDAVAVDPEGIGAGRAYIRSSYERNLPKFAALDMETIVQSHGDIVYVSWRAEIDATHALVGSDTFVIRDDLIQLHSFYSTIAQV